MEGTAAPPAFPPLDPFRGVDYLVITCREILSFRPDLQATNPGLYSPPHFLVSLPMNVSADLPITPAGYSTSPVADAVIWHHRAFCRIALPVRAPSKGAWQREAAGVALTMEAGDGAALPTGKFARLLLMYLFDLAVRSGDAVIEIGDDPAVVARRIGSETSGAKLRELQEQMIRLLAARITVSCDGGPALSVFDARGRSRSGEPVWRSSIRLTARFLAGLAESAVALDLRVLNALADSTLALDLYTWLAGALAEGDGVAATIVGWEDLRGRFGSASQPPAEFRAAVEQALTQIRQVWPCFASALRDDAVVFRRAAVAPPVEAPPLPVPAELPPPEPLVDAAALQAELEAELEFRPEPPPSVVSAVPAPSPVLPRTRQVTRQTVSLKSHLTGLPQVVWLQRANGRDNVVIEVTPGGRYDPEVSTVIALEPVALQVAGGLYARDFERVAAWAAANRDLIDDWWDSRLDDFEEVASRVKKVPAPAWR